MILKLSDLGDAPDSYATLRSTDGPRHMVGSLFLGAGVDAEVEPVLQPEVPPGADQGGNAPVGDRK